MVTRFSRRELLAGTASLAAASAGCRGVGGEDERFARSLLPSTASLEGLAVSAFPAVVARSGERLVVRAAAPSLDLAVEGDRPFALGFDNLPRWPVFSPAPQSLVWTGPISCIAHFAAGVRSIRVEGRGTGPVRVAVFSDPHVALEVFDPMADAIREGGFELAVCMGDFVQRGGADELERMFAALPRLGIPLYATLGNHDLFGDAGERYEALIGPSTLWFEHRGVGFLLLDSAGAMIAPSAYPWMEARLRQAPGPILAFTHIPPLDSNGFRGHAFRSREDALRLLQVLGDAGTDHLFAGHVHSYEAYRVRGIPAHLSGGAGGVLANLEGATHHFLAVEVDPGRLEPVRVERRDVAA